MSLALITGACAPSQQEFGIQLAELRATDTRKGVSVEARQQIRFSSEARSALRNGVPLRLRIDLSVQKSGLWSEAADDSIIYEIRYLPLSDRYELSGPSLDDPPRIFPRLRHVIADLANIEWHIDDFQTDPGHYKLSMRSHLDRAGMPGPMQLPMIFSSQWAHDSGWVSQQFEVGG